MYRNLKFLHMADFSPRAWPVGPRQISGLVFIFRCKVISTTETVTLQMWWMSNFGNAMARNMKIRSVRNPYELVLVQSAQHLQESGSYTLNSERQKNFDKFPATLGMCPPTFGRFLVSFGQFSQCKIDSPIFFQPQHGRHISLFS